MNNGLQEKIDQYLQTYELRANHDNTEIIDRFGIYRGVYDIVDESNIEDDGRITIVFHSGTDDGDTEIIPSLVIHF